MLAVLPIFAFISITLVLGNLDRAKEWRRAFLKGSVVWGSYMVLSTELLSTFRGITRLGLAGVWSLPVLAMLVWIGWRRGHGVPIAFPSWRPPNGWLDRALLLAVLVIVVLTGLIAWLTPPQTWDSLNYHLPRVAHWAQDRAVRHFATGIEVQNSMPPGAEMAMLQFYVLLGGDRLANFIEWFAMLGSLVGVSWIASQLGASRTGQLTAIVFTATIPMGIVQASSTMTDYVVAFWMVNVAAESLALLKDGVKPGSLILLSLAAGLAMVTKQTAFAYLLPFALLIFVVTLRRISLRKSLLYGVMALVLVLTLNSGHLIRNYVSYGNAVGPPERITEHANLSGQLSVLFVNLLRNASLHAASPWSRLNDEIYTLVWKAHIKLGLDPNDPSLSATGEFIRIGPLTTHEDLVGNPAQAFLILLLFIPILAARRILGVAPQVYALIIAATFLCFSFLFKWQVFGGRYHLPFFVLFAPVVGLSLSKFLPSFGVRMVAVGLVAASWPWLVSIQSRPLIPDDQSRVKSVIVETRQNLFFANGSGLIEPYTSMVNMIQENRCTTVGLMLSGAGAEYPLWVMLGTPNPDLYLEWIVSDTPSERYRSPNFQPCAVICGSCPQHWESIRGLPLEYNAAGHRLFINRTD